MTGYIIGLVLGFIIFLLQNFKPTSVAFRVAYLLTSIVFIIGIYFASLGGWNVILIPLGEILLAFISAVIFPYDLYSATKEIQLTNSCDYYKELDSKDKIGRINPPGFKQTYDRILQGILSGIVSNEKDLQKLGNELYSKNFYPISEHTKEEVVQHIQTSISKTGFESNDDNFLKKAIPQTSNIFNAFVSIMAIHEESTREIERLKKQRDNI